MNPTSQDTADSPVAVVTGGGSGIGAMTCRALSRDGMRIAVWDRNPQSAEAVASEIDAEGGTAVAVHADVADAESVARAAQATRDRLGPATVLVNNAGIRDLIPFFDLTAEDWHRVMDVCLSGAFHCTRALAPAMKAAGHGVIVNIASIAGISSRPNRTAYVSAKTGLVGLTRSNAEDLGPYGIRVNAIAPGFISTPLQAQSDALNGDILERIPLRRKGTPEDIASVVSFLCGDASRYVTGVVIPVDGGRSVVY
ncbi:3-oxoacyl-[acyl-carrier-protein] reductase [compost metagenome]